jgi:flagellum-specific peptidoglycan hydrolase FlgJ
MTLPFDQDVIAAAQASQSMWHVPSSVTIAQYGVESGWGKHMPPDSNNPFGIKAGGGQPFVEVSTLEWQNGRYVRMMQPFRKYESLAEAFEDHGRLLATNRVYAPAMACGINNPDGFANALTGHYATDPQYGAKLIAIMREFNLYQYDKPTVA